MASTTAPVLLQTVITVCFRTECFTEIRKNYYKVLIPLHRRIQPIMFGGSKPPISVWVGLMPNAQRADSGGVVLGEGAANGIGGGASAAKRFSCILEVQNGLSWNLLGANLRGRHGPIAPLPLNPSMYLFGIQCSTVPV